MPSSMMMVDLVDDLSATLTKHLRLMPLNEKSEGNLEIIEDASQSLGSKFKGKHSGTFSHLGCFSMYAAKVMTAGEGGAIVTDNKKLFVMHKINSTFIPIMKNILLETAVMGSINIRDINNFITHIIFKGKIFYMAILNEPELSMYLCTQFYPIYDWLMGR